MGALTRSRTRFQLMKRRLWKTKLKRLLAGWILIKQPRKRNLKRNKKSWKELPYHFYRRREVELEVCLVECPAVCQEECLIWEACQVQEEHHQPKIQQVDQPLRKSIKHSKLKNERKTKNKTTIF